MNTPISLSPAARRAIAAEAQRIKRLGDRWIPTPENLATVVDAVVAADRGWLLDHRMQQEQGSQDDGDGAVFAVAPASIETPYVARRRAALAAVSPADDERSIKRALKGIGKARKRGW